MGTTTAIEWCDHTFNPWIGCTKVSAACDHCYAETLTKRYGWAKWGAGEQRSRTTAANWRKPLAWNKAAAAAGVRRRVFCASLADVFDSEVEADWLWDVLALIEATPALDWLLLTKRPKVAKERLAAWAGDDGRSMPPNLWLGTTVEDQKMADLRIPILLSIPAKVHFLSCEPLLGQVRLDGWLCSEREDRGSMLRWVIAGGESGHNARPSLPDWFRLLRDQCAGAGVSFFFKQWGDVVSMRPSMNGTATFDGVTLVKDECPKRRPPIKGAWTVPHSADYPNWFFTMRVGKKATGAMLDGREHREFPT